MFITKIEQRELREEKGKRVEKQKNVKAQRKEKIEKEESNYIAIRDSKALKRVVKI